MVNFIKIFYKLCMYKLLQILFVHNYSIYSECVHVCFPLQRARNGTSSRFVHKRETLKDLSIGVSRSNLAGDGNTERIVPINAIIRYVLIMEVCYQNEDMSSSKSSVLIWKYKNYLCLYCVLSCIFVANLESS